MILKTFDHGWGTEWSIKALEQEIVSAYLAPLQQHAIKSIVINSTWYNQQAHAAVCDYIRDQQVDHVVLISMLDYAIVDASWFDDLPVKVSCVGYYHGADNLDFWALAVDKFFDRPLRYGFRAIDTAFMCLNRKPHWHRKKLFAELSNLGLLDQGLVTMGGDQGVAERSLQHDCAGSNLAPNPGPEMHGICNDIMSLGVETNWQRCFLQVVTETVFDIKQTAFVSEKIYKPMLAMRPFLVYASDGGRHWLHQQGFLDFCDDFGDICDLDLGLADNTAAFLAVLVDQPATYWRKKIKQLMPKLHHNRARFRVHCDAQLTKLYQGISLK